MRELVSVLQIDRVLFLARILGKIIISSATSSKIQIPSDWSTIQVRKNYSSIMAKHFIQHKYTSTSTSTSSMLLHIVRFASSIHVRLYSYFHLKYPKIMYLNWNVWIGNSKHGIMSIVKLLSGCNCMAVFRASFAFRLSLSLYISLFNVILLCFGNGKWFGLYP